MRELTVGKNDSGQRLDKFLMKALPDLPFSMMYKSIRKKNVKINGKRATPSQIIAEGDLIKLFIPDDFFPASDTVPSFANIRTDLDIVYEDENILLVNKRAGLSVHEDGNNSNNNLITYIQAYLYGKGEYDPSSEMSFAPALCNRIDRNTSGIVICAKNAQALRDMNARIKERNIDKYYLAAVHGNMPKKSDTLTAYLIKNEKTNTVKIYDSPVGGAKKIITAYRVITEKCGLSLVEVHLLTGRTHQIRAHMAHIGHPLLGDGKYGVNRADRRDGYKYQALCSYRLVFPTEKRGDSLDCLCGRTFEIPKEKIYFTKEF